MTGGGLDPPFPLLNAHVDAIKVIVREGVKDPTHQTGTILAGDGLAGRAVNSENVPELTLRKI